MTELQAQIAKLIDTRKCLERQLIKVHLSIENDISDKDRSAKVKFHISKCKEVVEEVYIKCDQLLKLAPKTDDPEKLKKQLEEWLDELVTKNDHFF